jgi:transcriptional regulator with PAS, ATPase and Fis domain
MAHPKRDPDDPEAPPLLAATIEALAGPCLVLDAQHALVAATEGACALLGFEPTLGARVDRALAPLDAPRRALAALLEPDATTIELEGAERRIAAQVSPLAGPRGGRRGVLVALRNAPAPTDEAIDFQGIWTRDPGMRGVFHVIERAALRDASVLVRGESGSGKELVARALHALSPRASGPFAAINCAALPGALLESELFGHVRGAFTGATRDHPGHFRSAHRGTLLLDEVAELPLELQAKLLRVLESKSVIPVGGREPIRVDVRIVAATHQSLRAAVEAGRFRADLMYRLRVIPIFLPPLRARLGDIALLTERLVAELNRQGGRQVLRVGADAARALGAHPWPGNVRELRNALEYAYVIGEGPTLRAADLPAEIADPLGAGRLDVADALDPGTATPHDEPPDREAPLGLAPAAPDAATLREAARLRAALDRAGGRRDRAADELGMSRTTLWRRLRELGLAPRRRP